MDKKIIGLKEIHPEKLADRVLNARKKAGLPVSKLAQFAMVQPNSVHRVEDPNGEPGVLTSINVAETAKAIDLNPFEVDSRLCDFVCALAGDLEKAADLYGGIANECAILCGSIQSENNVLAYYDLRERADRGRRKGRPFMSLNLFEPIDISDSVNEFGREFLKYVLPVDVGLLGRNRVSAMIRSGHASSEDKTVWNHLVAGRSINVGTRKLVDSAIALTREDLDRRAMKDDLFCDFCLSGFVNYLKIERLYEEALRENDRRPVNDFWKLVYDFSKTLRVVTYASRSGKD